MLDLVIRGQKVVVGGEIKPASIHIKDGVVVGIGAVDEKVQANDEQTIDPSLVLMGGLVDSHVHVNEPGRTEWEGFASATQAAAAGGVTTIVDMPLNSSPVTTTFGALQEKITSMDKKLYVDVGLLGGVVPNNKEEIEKMVREGGVVGFKCFMIHSGIDEFPAVQESDISAAMEVFAKLKASGMSVPFMFHAELAGPIDEATLSLTHNHAHPTNYSTFLRSRPKAAENSAIALVCKLAKVHQVPSHIVHLSSAEAIPLLQEAQKDGVPITVESTFHYLHLISEKVPDGKTQFKCCPPIREKENQDQLWKGLKEKVITIAISDHSPCVAELKRLPEGDFMKAWGGIASLQLGLPIMWTEARARNFSIFDIQKWMSEEPAKLVQLGDVKGPIQVGRDADFVIWNPDEEIVVDQTKLLFKNRLSPYHGERLFGKVYQTILRGQTVFKDENVVKEPIGTRLIPTRTYSRSSFPSPSLPPIHRLNSLEREVFQHSINLLFETAPPLFEPLWAKRPYESYAQLIETAKTVIGTLSPSDRLTVINAHPRIGLNPAQLSSLSKREQGAETSEAVFEELRKLNDNYESKFGFKFVVFVNGRQKSEIVPVLRERLESEKSKELELGLSEMMDIASDRLKKLLKSNM